MEDNHIFVIRDFVGNPVFKTNLPENDPLHVMFLFTKEKGVKIIPDNYHVELLDVEKYSAADVE